MPWAIPSPPARCRIGCREVTSGYRGKGRQAWIEYDENPSHLPDATDIPEAALISLARSSGGLLYGCSHPSGSKNGIHEDSGLDKSEASTAMPISPL